MYNQLIFAFRETVHNRDYIAQEQIYPAVDYDRMVTDIKAVMEDKKMMQMRLEKQREYAMAECKETYIELLGL